VDVDFAGYEGIAPLHYAATNGHHEVVEELIRKGAKVDIRNNNGSTPLFLAVHRNHVEACKILVQHGADVNAVDGKGSTPLCLAANLVNLECLRLLLQKGARVDDADSDGNTPLILTLKAADKAGEKHSQCISALLKANPKLNLRNEDGYTALHYAAQGGLYKWVEVLLQKGAQKNIANEAGKTPYLLARLNGKMQCAKLLR